MAQIQTVHFIDDLTGGEADETVPFALDGKQFEIDLSTGNAGELREKLASFLAAARRAHSAGRRGGSKGNSATTGTAARAYNQAVRAWARENGYPVSDRGRIPSEVLSAYDDANEGAARSGAGRVQFSG